MNPLDNIFRDGLAGRKAEVPDGLWERIAAQQPGQVPAGERIDHLFQDGLANRRAAVPADMWSRIQAARATAPHSGRQMLATALVFLLIGLLVYGVQKIGEENEERGKTSPQAELQEERRETTVSDKPQSVGISLAQGDGARVQASSTGTSPVLSDPETTSYEIDGSRNSRVVSSPVSARPTDATPAGTSVKSTTVTGTTAPTNNQQTRHPHAVALLPTAVAPLTPKSFNPLVLPLKKTTRIRKPGGFEPIGSNRLHGELLAGIGYTNQTLTANGDENMLRQEEREVTEFPEASLQFSARLRYRLTPRLRLTTGLTYAELRNRFEYDQLIDGTPTLLERTNKLRMVEVPLLLSYELPGRRLRLALNGGLVANAFTAVSGGYQDPASLEPQSLRESGFYRRSVGIGYTTSLTAAYPIAGGRLQLLLEPYFKAYPRSFTTGGAPVSERYWTAGLQLGIRKLLR